MDNKVAVQNDLSRHVSRRNLESRLSNFTASGVLSSICEASTNFPF